MTPAEEFQRIVNQIDFSESETDETFFDNGKEVQNKQKKVMPGKIWDMMRETMRYV